ncbi:MAG: TolC family protein [Bryobacteraceae bacterium]
MRVATYLSLTAIACAYLAMAQTSAPVPLTLQDAEALALKNHPQVLAAQHALAAQDQRIVENRAAYYPGISGVATGSQANRSARIGAGFLSDSSLFNRFGSGIEIGQLITDSGRTANLVAQSRLLRNAAGQTYQATRYDVLMAVNQAYFDVLRSQATVRVAQETIAARQLLVDQVTALANSKLRSELDVSFADVSRSEAQLLLIRAQDQVQRAFAEFTRTIGAQQTATYRLSEEPLPPSPAQNVEELVAQALKNRPELAGLRLSRDAAYRLERAERDLSRPTVGFVAVAGYMPYIDQITLPRVIPGEYEGAAVNVSVPIFNGHLFSARREEAHEHALEADQRVRDLEESITRDVRAAWASSVTAYQQLDVTAQLLREATLGMSLAQGRYNIGLSSIVELTQAQLNLTSAEIENLTAKYGYQAQYAGLQYEIGALR